MSSLQNTTTFNKKTYLSRSKRNKATSADNADSSSESEEDTTMPAAKPASKAAATTTPPAPSSPGKLPKKVDVHLPGPSPRSSAKPPSQSASPLAKTKSVHKRSASSISSVKRLGDDSSAAGSPSSSSKKPPSAINRKRFATPETVDDNASVAESSVAGTGTIRRTEAERIEYFNNQSDCTDIEPHNVTCTRCNRVVQLGRKQTYTVKPWENHRRRCDQKALFDDAASVRSDMRSEVAATRTTLEERKAILEGDQRAETVEPDQILCRKCQKWIRLSSRTPYALHNWNQHQASCGDAMVSSRVAAAQRKILLVNDAQAETKGPRSVLCAVCKTNVELVGEHEYTLTNWELHKQTCPGPSPTSGKGKAAPAKGKGKDKAFKAPESSASAAPAATVVAGASTSGAPEASSSSARGTKRRLEEDPEAEASDPDVRAANRPRKETYVPVQKEAPSLLGWFLLPFKAFMTGFRESIAESPP